MSKYTTSVVGRYNEPTQLLSALYRHWRVYSLYRSLDDVKHRIVYAEFPFPFQEGKCIGAVSSP
jgi:hypothetical protein